MLDRAEHLEVPLPDISGRYRSEVQERPAVGSGEGLAGRNARRIDTLRESFALEQKRHLASIGTDGRRWLFRPRDPIRARRDWLFPPLLEHRGRQPNGGGAGMPLTGQRVGFPPFPPLTSLTPWFPPVGRHGAWP